MEGIQKAAVLMFALGESDSARIMKLMKPKDVEIISQTMIAMEGVERNVLETVVADFIEDSKSKTSFGSASTSFVKNMLQRALGDEQASRAVKKILKNTDAKGIDALKWMDSDAVIDLIRDEHPQVIATILCFLEDQQAAELIGLFEDQALQVEVLQRIAKIQDINPLAIEKLNDSLEKQIVSSQKVQPAEVGGITHAAAIVNFLPSEIESEIMAKIREKDEELGNSIQDSMFVFENIMDIDNRAMQTLIKDLPSEKLAIALKGADNTLREKFFNNMSKNAAALLRDDLETQGPVRISEVEEAQKAILVVVQKKIEDGDIILMGKGSSEFI